MVLLSSTVPFTCHQKHQVLAFSFDSFEITLKTTLKSHQIRCHCHHSNNSSLHQPNIANRHCALLPLLFAEFQKLLFFQKIKEIRGSSDHLYQHDPAPHFLEIISICLSPYHTYSHQSRLPLIIKFLMSEKSGQHSDHQSSNDNCKVYISNINKDIVEDEIRRKFSEFGVIKSLILKKKENNVTYSFIQYEKASEAKAAIAEMDKKSYFDRILKVQHGKGGNRGLQHYHSNRYDKLKSGYARKDSVKKKSYDRYSSRSSYDSYDDRYRDRSPVRKDRARKDYKDYDRYDKYDNRGRSRSYEREKRDYRDRDYRRDDRYKDRRDYYERDDRDRYYDDRRYRDERDDRNSHSRKDRKDDRRDYDKYEKERRRDYQRSPHQGKFEEFKDERYKDVDRYRNDRHRKETAKEGERYDRPRADKPEYKQNYKQDYKPDYKQDYRPEYKQDYKQDYKPDYKQDYKERQGYERRKDFSHEEEIRGTYPRPEER